MAVRTRTKKTRTKKARTGAQGGNMLHIHVRFIVWNGGSKRLRELRGFLRIQSNGRAAWFVPDGKKARRITLPIRLIKEWRDKISEKGFNSATSLVLQVTHGGANGAAIPRIGDYEVTPYQTMNASWFLLTNGSERSDEDDISVHDLHGHRLEISCLTSTCPVVRVFDIFDEHFEIDIPDWDFDDPQQCYFEAASGGPYFCYPIVPCPPSEEPPRNQLIIEDGLGHHFESAVRGAKCAFHLIDDSENPERIELAAGADRRVQLFRAGSTTIVTVGRSYRKRYIELKIGDAAKAICIDPIDPRL